MFIEGNSLMVLVDVDVVGRSTGIVLGIGEVMV